MATTTHAPISPPVNTRARQFTTWKLLAWGGPIYCIGELISWAGIAHFIPPPRESWSAERVAHFYRQHEVGIRLGMEGVLIFALFYFTFSLALARVMERHEGPHGFMHRVQLMGGLVSALITMGCAVAWLTASLRAGSQDARNIQMMNDLGWMVFDMTVMATLFQFVAFGVIWLQRSDRATPLMPRWMSYFSFWCAASFVSVYLMPSFHTGPFSWQGLITLYVALGLFFIWIAVVSIYLLRAIRTLEREAA
jgi:hypothetical protein